MKYPSRFEAALAFVLMHEGGYVNDPSDPGGETNYGISKRAYPLLDIKALTREQAAEIYWRDYWCAANCGVYQEGVGGFLFDAAVNQGVGFALKIQEVSVNPSSLIVARLRHYSATVARTPSQLKYLRGWVNRVADAVEAFFAGERYS